MWRLLFSDINAINDFEWHNHEASATALWLSEYTKSVSDNYETYWESEAWLSLTGSDFHTFDFASYVCADFIVDLTELICDNIAPVTVLSLDIVAESA